MFGQYNQIAEVRDVNTQALIGVIKFMDILGDDKSGGFIGSVVHIAHRRTIATKDKLDYSPNIQNVVICDKSYMLMDVSDQYERPSLGGCLINDVFRKKIYTLRLE